MIKRSLIGMNFMRRRNARRYTLTTPIRIEPPDQAAAHLYEGTVLDASTSGIYLVSENDPEVGSRLNLKMTFLVETDGYDTIIDALARVVRVERHTEGPPAEVGIAVKIERYEIVRPRSASRTAI
jgi:hypothetical protein